MAELSEREKLVQKLTFAMAGAAAHSIADGEKPPNYHEMRFAANCAQVIAALRSLKEPQ